MTTSKDTPPWLTQALERRLREPTLLAVADASLVDAISKRLIGSPQARMSNLLVAYPGQGMPQVMPPLMPINPGPVYDPVAMEKAHARMFAQAMTRFLLESCGILCCPAAADVERHAADWGRIQDLGTCVIVGPAAVLDLWPHAGRSLVVD